MAACSSSSVGSCERTLVASQRRPRCRRRPSAPSTRTPSSTLIPYNVGEMTGLPSGWRVEVERVKRASVVGGLPAPGAGRDYVTVDIRVINDEGPNVRFDAAALFQLYDEGNNAHRAVAVPGSPERARWCVPVRHGPRRSTRLHGAGALEAADDPGRAEAEHRNAPSSRSTHPGQLPTTSPRIRTPDDYDATAAARSYR